MMISLEKQITNVSFAIGTGRCGTHFLAKVIEKEKQFSAIHERNPLNDTFHRYCKWYGIAIDHEGYLVQKEMEIAGDLERKNFSFESSAFLSLSVLELYERFNAKFIFVVRSPEKVINSYVSKGWYKNKFVFSDPNLPLSYQQNKEFHHFLGRMAPVGSELVTWNERSQISKLGWYWAALNERVLELLDKIPTENYVIQRLEDLNYRQYIKILSFLGSDATVSEKIYNKISDSKPSSYKNKPTMSSWTAEDYEYVKEVTKPVAGRLGYDVDAILKR